MQVAQGQLGEALQAYRDGLAIAERLAKSDSSNAEWQRRLSVAYAKLATAFRKTDSTADALNALRQGQAIMGKLAAASPDNAQWREDLSWFNHQIAELTK